MLMKRRCAHKHMQWANNLLFFCVQDVKTRWGTKQKMIDRVLEQLPAIKRVLDHRTTEHLIPTWQDISVLESVNAALKPVAEFTNLLSGENYVTVSSVKPTLTLLTRDSKYLAPKDGDSTLTRDMKKKMCTVLEEKYKPAALQALLAKGCMLDPRYRGTRIDDVDETKHALLDEMLALPDRSDEGSSSSAAAGDSMPPPAKKKATLADLLKSPTTAPVVIVPKRVRAETELTRYLQEQPNETTDDPLVWWRGNQARFPMLSRIARKYMCICATSTPSERVFSAAGNVVTPLRSSLKPHKVNMLVFLARNNNVIEV